MEFRFYGEATLLHLRNLALPSLECVVLHPKNLTTLCLDFEHDHLEDTKTDLHDDAVLDDLVSNTAMWLRLILGPGWQGVADWLVGPSSTAQVVFKIDCLCQWADAPFEYGPIQQYLLVSHINRPDLSLY